MQTSIRGLLAATVLAGSALMASPAFAQDETDPPKDITISGNVVGTTDYRWRGLSYSGGDFAVQGQINVAHSSGFYAGLWGSSLEQDLDDLSTLDDEYDIYGSAELDVYAGWSGEVASGLTADVGLTWYTYPNGTNPGFKANYFEPYASLSAGLGPVTAKVGVNYAWEQDALGGDDNLYLFTDLSTSIPNTPVGLSAHLGYTDGVLSPNALTGVSTDGGFDYSVGATYNVTENLSVGVSYVGVDGASIDGFSNDAAVATVKLAF